MSFKQRLQSIDWQEKARRAGYAAGVARRKAVSFAEAARHRIHEATADREPWTVNMIDYNDGSSIDDFVVHARSATDAYKLAEREANDRGWRVKQDSQTGSRTILVEVRASSTGPRRSRR